MISNKMEYYRWNMGAKIPKLTMHRCEGKTNIIPMNSNRHFPLDILNIFLFRGNENRTQVTRILGKTLLQPLG